MERKTWIGLAAAAMAAAAVAGACERRKPAPSDAAQKELERRQPDLMAEMDRIAGQQPPSGTPGPSTPPPLQAPAPPAAEPSHAAPGGPEPSTEPPDAPTTPPPG